MDKIATTGATNTGGLSNNSHLNFNTIEVFRNVLSDQLGYAPDYITGDSKLHRFKDNDGKMNGAYVLHLDNRPAGYFQCFKQGIKQNWKADGSFMPLPAFQVQASAKARQIEESAKHLLAAEKACYIWNKAPPAPASHPYLVKKHIGIHGARLGRDNTLMISLYNTKEEIVNLQFIGEEGSKRFLSGGQKKGCFYWIGEHTSDILIAEGFATACSLHEDSGLLTVVAFDAGNLTEVAKNIKSLAPNANLIICGDNDISGVGQAAALAAARAIGGKYLLPKTAGNDWNDELSMEVAV